MVASESQGVQSGGIQTQKIIPVLFQAITTILQFSSSGTRQAVLGTPHNILRGGTCWTVVMVKHFLFVALY